MRLCRKKIGKKVAGTKFGLLGPILGRPLGVGNGTIKVIWILGRKKMHHFNLLWIQEGSLDRSLDRILYVIEYVIM